MIKQPPEKIQPQIDYPDSDGQPMADNTKQFRWIVMIKENLEILFANNDEVFVAGDLLWYPVQGDNKIRVAPDIMVVFGRPKGDRSSYKQWEENNLAPQVVFEILSPGNTTAQMAEKLLFYQRFGVQEYYIYDPNKIELSVLQRSGDWLDSVAEVNGWVSPHLGIRFQLTEDTLEIYRPDGGRFLTPLEIDLLRQQESQRAEQEREEKERALRELEAERQRYQALIESLRARGIEPEEM
ncbi:Uma2 family endonuclease [Oscillatoria salina]|uniref:Uma2 family endonuclease n=1 Tax=Oscillatoria salina TaxID=331517 RepID=UPI0013BCBFCC|nr:Uma2 family endonuclease [Oscillatoria salina]MBZ8179118.1 Uma2 family endonuclease [Oscillatoria salina IIICB1]NET87009.1 Uma2 family endonuclease [Kamptonema sp. SIO1D9]